MDRENVHHYHIRWASVTLDWETHSTPANAEEAAKALARPHERYRVEEFQDDTCPQCSAKRAVAGR